MKKINIKIGNKSFLVKVAETDEQKEKGLQDIKELPENEGMLFIFDPPEEVSFWMQDTFIPLDIIFINSDLVVTKVETGVPNSDEYITQDDTNFVLEVNAHSGIVEGEELEFSPEMNQKMQVLKEDGTTQMELDGGERIFSRANTKILVKFAKRAYATKSEKNYKDLGKRVFKFLDIQESNDPEYVNE
jgi:uncharacterized membrane protein (UPF0127 family)